MILKLFLEFELPSAFISTWNHARYSICMIEDRVGRFHTVKVSFVGSIIEQTIPRILKVYGYTAIVSLSLLHLEHNNCLVSFFFPHEDCNPRSYDPDPPKSTSASKSFLDTCNRGCHKEQKRDQSFFTFLKTFAYFAPFRRLRPRTTVFRTGWQFIYPSTDTRFIVFITFAVMSNICVVFFLWLQFLTYSCIDIRFHLCTVG